ncbi:MAG: hypothetical protein II598_00310, partial [Elusimicrobia bacterium]|nr:hypothetical protein [Elusimicrobiota bacterium]
VSLPFMYTAVGKCFILSKNLKTLWMPKTTTTATNDRNVIPCYDTESIKISIHYSLFSKDLQILNYNEVFGE